MLADLLVAIIYLYSRFGALYALFVSIITFYYLHLTMRMAATRADQRRDMVNADREEEAVKNDSIMSYKTVKYYNAERREFRRYGNAVKKFQGAKSKVIYGINYMNMCQSAVFMSYAAIGATFYRTVQSAIISGERLLELFKI
ncbi:hypothetical protein VTK26DRAFT_2673 [Humicola hyalothermophila]